MAMELFVVKLGSKVVERGFGNKPGAKQRRDELNKAHGMDMLKDPRNSHRVSKGEDHWRYNQGAV